MKKALVDTCRQYDAQRLEHKEHNDCTVISLAAVTCGNYRLALNRMRLIGGRRHRKPALLQPVAEHLGFEEVKGIDWDNRITLKEFCEAHPRGRYWLAVRGHALAVIDGQIHDHALKPRRRVYAAWRFNQPQPE